MRTISVREFAGFSLLGVSCIAWGILPVIPFLPASTTEKTAWAGIVFIFAEVTWWSAVPLLGPEFVQFTRSTWSRFKSFIGRSGDVSDKDYLSFIEQTLHYFDRPYESVPDKPVEVPAAWRGAEMPPLEQMAYQLSGREVAELQSAVMTASGKQRETRDLTEQDFPLPLLSRQFPRWRRELKDGVGFQVVRGVPVEQWTQQQSELFFWCFGLHLGRPGEQNPEGDLLGHVIDTGTQDQDPNVRLYKTASNIDYHCDAADVVGLLCLNKARTGGQSRIVSSVTVFNELLRRRPDLAPRLFEPLHLDIRDKEVNEAGSSLAVPPCRFSHGQLRTFYHADYFRSVERHHDVPPLDEHERALLDTYEAIAMEEGMYLDMDLQPGDIQLLSNHTNLHARTQYEDHADPAKKRHLLRLWLSL